MGTNEDVRQQLYMRCLITGEDDPSMPVIPVGVIQDVTSLIDDALDYVTADTLTAFTTPDFTLTGTLNMSFPGKGCKTRKRLIKLMMSIGYSRDRAISAACLFIDCFGWSCANTWECIYVLNICNGRKQ